MYTLSPLQTLPLHIVERIVDLVVGSICLVFTDRKVDHNGLEYLRPLLAICHNLRAIAYPRFCRRFKLKLSEGHFRHFSMQYVRTGHRLTGYPSNACFGYPTNHLVKDLEIELEEWAIYTGKALRMLSCAPYDEAFPLVGKLTLSFDWDEHDESDGYGDVHEYNAIDQRMAETNISAFVQWIKQKAPMVNKIRIQPGASVDESDATADENFGELISRLYQLVDHVDLDSYDGSKMATKLQFDNIRHLTHISYTSDGFGNQFTLLARQNAPKLQSLVLMSKGEEYIDTCSLITNVDGSGVIFLCLLKLRLDMRFDDDMSQQAVHSGPALSLTEAWLELWNVLSLIKSLPLLSDLHIFSAQLGLIPTGIEKSNLPAYIRSKYAPVGERFRCWHFHGYLREIECEIVNCVLLLALACPAFDYASSPTCDRSSFTESMLEAIESDMLKDYAPRLQRLL
ncbi:hypothetical protein GGI17_004731 [Coemansia sp. S146]|nr:hypothetical protein GGI17_004731 [Coemansia sp. S146]